MAKMPEPVAEIMDGFSIFWAGADPIVHLIERTGAKIGDRLITTTQAEAYKDACVREALEEINRRIIAEIHRTGDTVRIADVMATARALIPTE